MNLSQAYLGWQQQSENRKLYVNTRDAFRKAWFTLPTNKPCSYYTKEVLGMALAETREVESVKTKAASVMCQVLSWAHWAEPKFNPEPDFTFDDLMEYTKGPLANPDIVKQHGKPSCPEDMDDTDLDIDPVTALPRQRKEQESVDSIHLREKMQISDLDVRQIATTTPMEPCDEHGNSIPGSPSVMVPLPADDDSRDPMAGIEFPDEPNETKPEKDMEPKEKKPRGREPKPVAQIDPKTLNVVKVWSSRSDAERQLGAHNIDRCVKLLRKSADFYWCDADQADDFKERLKAKTKAAAEKTLTRVKAKTKVAKKPKAKTAKPKKLDNPDYEPIHKSQEDIFITLRSGDFAAPATTVAEQPHNAAADALKIFTDEELLAELDRRGFEGELTRVQRFAIGRKALAKS